MSDLERRQRAFAAHLRDPQQAPPPQGIEPRRIAVYRDLFFNNLRELLGGTFPICRSILGEAGWSRLVRCFFAGYKAQTPYFLELPREFVEWMADAGAEPPFLAELAHYEWVELALSIAEDAPAGPVAVDPDGDLLEGGPVLSPLAWLLAYRWPVHRLSPDCQPARPPDAPTFIVLNRDTDGSIGFLQVDAFGARLIERLEEGPATSGRELLLQIAAGQEGADAAALYESGCRMLHLLRKRGILIGTVRP